MAKNAKVANLSQLGFHIIHVARPNVMPKLMMVSKRSVMTPSAIVIN
jgi:hypothetical protein